MGGHVQSSMGQDLDERPRRRLEPAGVLRWLVFPAAVLALIFGVLLYLDGRLDDGTADDRFGIVELPSLKNPTGRAPASEIGRAGPDFLLETPQGGTLRLSDFQGRPVVLNFFASWCRPCRREMPEFVAAYSRYRAQGLVIVGVDMQEPAKKVLKFADDFGIRFPLAIDRDGEVGDAWRLGGPIQGLPSTYFIDATGVIRDRFYGPLTEEFLEKRLAQILPEEPG